MIKKIKDLTTEDLDNLLFESHCKERECIHCPFLTTRFKCYLLKQTYEDLKMNIDWSEIEEREVEVK